MFDFFRLADEREPGKYQGLFTMWCHFSIGKHTRNSY